MSTPIEFAFASLSNLKTRLGIKTSDLDSALSDALVFSSAAIENAAGRRLRRAHAVSETFRGGGPLIRTNVWPIAQVHWIRESENRNFETATEYEELVAGTDYVLDADLVGKPEGAAGFIRRLGASWLGSPAEPGKVKVQYTGGYKTRSEEAMENQTIVLSDSRVVDFTMYKQASTLQQISNESSTILQLSNLAGGFDLRPLFVIDTTRLLIPTWGIIDFVVSIQAKLAAPGNMQLLAKIVKENGLTNDLDALRAAVTTGVQLGEPGILNSTSYVGEIFTMISESQRSAIEQTIHEGHITIGIDMSTSLSDQITIRSMDEPVPADRPKITIKHRPGPADPFGVPDDLRQANLIQASHDYQTRFNPGTLSESQRGVAIASGSSIRKNESILLPQVLAVARRYATLY